MDSSFPPLLHAATWSLTMETVTLSQMPVFAPERYIIKMEILGKFVRIFVSYL